MQFAQEIAVGSCRLGRGHPCFLVAEVGINHNGDLDLAIESIDAAADAGADAVKFQNYRTEDFVADRSLTFEYLSQGRRVVESQYELFKRCELPEDSLQMLLDHCLRRGVAFLSTPTSEEGIAALVRIGVPMLKNGSDYLTNLPLVRAMASTGVGTVLSTGMANLAEIDEAVRSFWQAGGQRLVLLHCTSAYPTPPADVNLRRIPLLASVFGCPVGFSDHSEGNVAAIGSVAMGATLIEKHFTLDKNLPGPDHRFSADARQFRQLVEAVRLMEQSLGSSDVLPTDAEAQGRNAYRLSCAAARELSEGCVLQPSDILLSRPGTGFPPSAMSWITGLRLTRNVAAGRIFDKVDFT